MLRFIYVIIGNLHRIWMIPLMGFYSRYPDKYSEEFRYRYDLKVVRKLMKTGRITTSSYGTQHLPQQGGYVMYPNHQGKFDALSIMYSHKNPCTIVMDDARSHGPLVKQFLDLVQGKRMKLHDLRQAAGVIKEVTNEVRNGKRYIIFPAGGYRHRNGNSVDPFKPGSFKAAIRSKAPIVPVAIVDSWRVFDLWSLKKVHTQVYFLTPIVFEDYRDLKSVEISELVYKRISKAISYAEKGMYQQATDC